MGKDKKLPDPMKMRIIKIIDGKKYWRHGFRSNKKAMDAFKQHTKQEPSSIRTVKVKGGYLLYSRPADLLKRKRR